MCLDNRPLWSTVDLNYPINKLYKLVTYSYFVIAFAIPFTIIFFILIMFYISINYKNLKFINLNAVSNCDMIVRP